MNGADVFHINGEAGGDGSGSSVAGAGDVNDDGFDDLVIGAPSDVPGGSSSGAAYVVFGRATGPVMRTGTRADENFAGGDFDDQLFGARGDDRLSGGGGDDQLFGGRGRDELIGGANADTLKGGLSPDLLTGGTGADVFVLASLADSLLGMASDRIRDFKRGDDQIDLSAIDADGDPANGDQAFAFVGRAGFTGAGGEVGYRAEAEQMVVELDINGDRSADAEIRLDGQFFITSGDFRR